MSGVVRGAAVVAEVVEDLSSAYNTTKIATTYEDDDDDDDDDNNDNGADNAARRATFNAPVMRGPFRPSPECGAIQGLSYIVLRYSCLNRHSL